MNAGKETPSNISNDVEKHPETKTKVITTNDAIVISRGNENVNETVGKILKFRIIVVLFYKTQLPIICISSHNFYYFFRSKDISDRYS